MDASKEESDDGEPGDPSSQRHAPVDEEAEAGAEADADADVDAKEPASNDDAADTDDATDAEASNAKEKMDQAWDDSQGNVASNDEEEPTKTSPRDPIMEEIAERLQCCKLPHTVPTPMQSCANGHLVCKTCLIGLKKAKEPKCPKCDVALTGALFTNLAFANIASQCVVSCRYSECGVKCLHSDLDNHLQYCQLPTKKKAVSYTHLRAHET